MDDVPRHLMIACADATRRAGLDYGFTCDAIDELINDIECGFGVRAVGELFLGVLQMKVDEAEAMNK